MISPETQPSSHASELSTSERVKLINEIITGNVLTLYDSTTDDSTTDDSTTESEKIVAEIADNIIQVHNRVRSLPNSNVYIKYLEAIFGDISHLESNPESVKKAVRKILKTAQSIIDAGVDEGITHDATSYTSSEIGKLTAKLRQEIAEEKSRASAAETPPTSQAVGTNVDQTPSDGIADHLRVTQVSQPTMALPVGQDSQNLDRIEFAFEIARLRLERQALIRAQKEKEELRSRFVIKNKLKEIYDVYQSESKGDYVSHLTSLFETLGVNNITNADIKEKIEAVLRDKVDSTLLRLDDFDKELKEIVKPKPDSNKVPNPLEQSKTLITFKYSLQNLVSEFELVSDRESELNDDDEASKDFEIIKTEFLEAVRLLLQDCTLRYETVALAHVDNDLPRIVNYFRSVIEDKLDIQDSKTRARERLEQHLQRVEFIEDGLAEKTLSTLERAEQTRLVQNLRKKVEIMLGDVDLKNEYEELTFTQSLEKILQLVEVVDVDSSLILQTQQYWSQFLDGRDAAGEFGLVACFTDTDQHAVAALLTKLTTQRNQIIESFSNKELITGIELTLEQKQLAIEAVCVIDLCRNRLSFVLREVNKANEASKVATSTPTSSADSPSERTESNPLPETTDPLVSSYRGESLYDFFQKYIAGAVYGTDAITAWSQVLKEKAAGVKAKGEVPSQMKEFIEALAGPVGDGLFSDAALDFANLTTKGPEAIRGRLSRVAVHAYDAFRSTEVYSKVVEKIGDFAYYLMYDCELEVLMKLKSISSNPDEIIEWLKGKNTDNLPDDKKVTLRTLQPSIDIIKGRLKFLLGEGSSSEDINNVLKLLIRYKTGGYSDKNKTFKFDWDLITTNDRELQVRDWAAKGDWSNGVELMQFCAEIIFKYNSDARSLIGSVDEAHSGENKVTWLSSKERKDIPNLLMYIAQADTALRERRKKAAEFHLLRHMAAFKFPNSAEKGGIIFLNDIVYQVGKGNDKDRFATALAFAKPDYRYVNAEGLPRISDRYARIIDFLAFRFGRRNVAGIKALRALMDSAQYLQILEFDKDFEGDHRNQIGRLGSASVPLSLDDFLTNYDRKNRQRGSAADSDKLFQTIEALHSLIEFVVDAWGNDQTESFKEKTVGDLANYVSASFQKFGSDIAKAFAYASSLPERFKSELFELLMALCKSYTIYILGQLQRNPYLLEDTEYDNKYEAITGAIREYFDGNKSFLVLFKDRQSDKTTTFYDAMSSFFKVAFKELKQDNRNYLSNIIANGHVAAIQWYNLQVQKRDEKAREEQKAKGSPISRVMRLVNFLLTGGDFDLKSLNRPPKWPFGRDRK
jgi:hypothetical protein